MRGRMFKCPKCGRVTIANMTASDVVKSVMNCPECGTFINHGRLIRYGIDAGSGVDQGALTPLVDGTLNTDGYLHIGKDDVLVLRTDSVLAKLHREEFEENMSEKLGIKVVLIDRAIEVIGVVEHGGDAGC